MQHIRADAAGLVLRRSGREAAEGVALEALQQVLHLHDTLGGQVLGPRQPEQNRRHPALVISLLHDARGRGDFAPVSLVTCVTMIPTS
jgi:hypothetical protein